MSMLYEKITEFDKGNEDWVSHAEKVKLFFEANGIEEETKKRLFYYRVLGCKRTSYWKAYQCQANG